MPISAPESLLHDQARLEGYDAPISAELLDPVYASRAGRRYRQYGCDAATRRAADTRRPPCTRVVLALPSRTRGIPRPSFACSKACPTPCSTILLGAGPVNTAAAAEMRHRERVIAHAPRLRDAFKGRCPCAPDKPTQVIHCVGPHPHQMQRSLSTVYRKASEGFVGFVEELPGANTQGATLDEARANLREAVLLVLEANRQLVEEELVGADVIREPLLLSA